MLAAEPPSPQRAEIERLLEVARLGPQRNLGGVGSPRLAGAGDAQGRAKLAMLSAEASLLTSTGRLEEALPLAEWMLDAANQWGEDAIVAHAHWRVGLIHHLAGYLQEAERHFVGGQCGARRPVGDGSGGDRTLDRAGRSLRAELPGRAPPRAGGELLLARDGLAAVEEALACFESVLHF